MILEKKKIIKKRINMHNLWVFYYFFQNFFNFFFKIFFLKIRIFSRKFFSPIFFVPKSFLTKNYFLIAEINLTTWGPLYACHVIHCLLNYVKSHKSINRFVILFILSSEDLFGQRYCNASNICQGTFLIYVI